MGGNVDAKRKRTSWVTKARSQRERKLVARRSPWCIGAQIERRMRGENHTEGRYIARKSTTKKNSRKI